MLRIRRPGTRCKALLILYLLIFILQYGDVFAGSRYNSTTGTKDFCATISNESGTVSSIKCEEIKVPNGSFVDHDTYFSLSVGTQTDGATSMTSAQTAVSTSYTYTRKAIANDPAFNAGTLANSTSGKFLIIYITAVASGGTWTLTPTTKTGFASIVFDAPGDSVAMLYLGDTDGWVIVGKENVTVNLP